MSTTTETGWEKMLADLMRDHLLDQIDATLAEGREERMRHPLPVRGRGRRPGLKKAKAARSRGPRSRR